MTYDLIQLTTIWLQKNMPFSVHESHPGRRLQGRLVARGQDHVQKAFDLLQGRPLRLRKMTRSILKKVSEWVHACVRAWVSECVRECVSAWVRACVRACVSEWVSEWVSGWVGEWVSGWVGEWVSGWVSEWVSEWKMYVCHTNQIGSTINSQSNFLL